MRVPAWRSTYTYVHYGIKVGNHRAVLIEWPHNLDSDALLNVVGEVDVALLVGGVGERHPPGHDVCRPHSCTNDRQWHVCAACMKFKVHCVDQ